MSVEATLNGYKGIEAIGSLNNASASRSVKKPSVDQLAVEKKAVAGEVPDLDQSYTDHRLDARYIWISLGMAVGLALLLVAAVRLKWLKL